MHGTAASNLITGMLAGHEAEQFQHLSHGHARTHFLKSKPRHGSAPHKAAGTRYQDPRNREEEPVTEPLAAPRCRMIRGWRCRGQLTLWSTQ
jgi:hypothetical protein